MVPVFQLYQEIQRQDQIDWLRRKAEPALLKIPPQMDADL
jgi:hypothetical protein